MPLENPPAPAPALVLPSAGPPSCRHRAGCFPTGPRGDGGTPKAFRRRLVRSPVPAPRWLADEMLGRLARYLRFLGHDTEYVRGASDDEIVDRARLEGRRLVTRDRLLARRTPGALLLDSPYLPEQLRRIHAEVPGAGFELTFDRCTLCNGRLLPWAPAPGEPRPAEVPPITDGTERPVFSCEHCAHRYWEGSHTAQIRRQLAGWLSQ